MSQTEPVSKRLRDATFFTNRVAENRAFSLAVHRHLENLSDGTVSRSSQSRRNVATFYGVGGIGKTTLSDRLESWVSGRTHGIEGWAVPPRTPEGIATLRWDLHGRVSVDPIEFLLRLRGASAAPGVRFSAFDLGFALWWASARPGVELPPVQSRLREELRDQVLATVGDALAMLGLPFAAGALTARVALALTEAVRKRRLSDEALVNCDALREFADDVERDPSMRTATRLADLLAWDVEQALDRDPPVVIVFVDAIDWAIGGATGQEAIINDLVYLSPRVLWVISTRESLTWATREKSGELPATGPGIWPNLVDPDGPEPRQHLVGDFAPEDVERYLSVASGGLDNPHLTAAMRSRIAQGAKGVPIYLDLSLALAREAAAVGNLSADTFGGPLPELVRKYFSHLSDEQRRAARVACLLPRFDAELISTAGDVPLALARRFARSALVRADNDPFFPLRVHDAIREAVLAEPETYEGAWAREDFDTRAERLLEQLKRRDAANPSDPALRRQILGLAAGICDLRSLAAPWLMESAFELPKIAQQVSVFAPATGDRWVDWLSRLFACWRPPRPVDRQALLRGYAAKTPFPEMRALAERHLAYGLREGKDIVGALEILRRLHEEQPESDLYRFQIALTHIRVEDFTGLAEFLAGSPLQDASHAGRIDSDIGWAIGDMERACSGVALRTRSLDGRGMLRVAGGSRAVTVWRRAIAGSATIAECDEGANEADHWGYEFNLRSFLAASSVCLARARPEESLAKLREARRIALSRSAGVGWREWASGLVWGIVNQNEAATALVKSEWNAAEVAVTPGTRLVDRLLVRLGEPSRLPPVDPSPYSTPREVENKWAEVLDKLVAS